MEAIAGEHLDGDIEDLLASFRCRQPQVHSYPRVTTRWPGAAGHTLYAATKGYLDELPLNSIERFEEGFHAFVAEKYEKIHSGIREAKAITPEVETALKEALAAYLKQFKASLS